MTLEIKLQKHDDPGEARSGLVEVKQRLWLTADRDQVVPDGHPDAAFLYAMPGWSVARDEAIRYGLIKAGKQKASGEAAGDKQPAALADLTVVELDELAAKHELADYPAKGKKAEKVGFLDGAGVTAAKAEE